MSMREAITNIVGEIEPGHTFDSHFVVRQLIEKNSDEYIRFAGGYAHSERLTLTSHQRIGHEIANLNELVERQGFDSWSENIHGRPSTCAAWRKR